MPQGNPAAFVAPSFPVVVLPPLSEWFLSGTAAQNYTADLEAGNLIRSDIGSLKSHIDEPYGLGMWTQQIPANDHRSQRLRFSGYIRAENVEKWAGLWMRVDDAQGQLLSFDFMQSRPIHGTQPWARYEVVLDVPKEGTTIAFGILLDGRGEIWLRDVLMEIVDSSIVTTNWGPPRQQAVGLNFESDIFAWGLTGNYPYDYNYVIDTSMVYEGNQGGYLYSRTEAPTDFGAVGQAIQVGLYLNRRLQLSGYLKTEEVEKSAGLWLRVDDTDGRMLSFDNMADRSISGTTDWQPYSVVVDVPSTGSVVNFGVWLEGRGEVWMDDFEFEIISEDVITPP